MSHRENRRNRPEVEDRARDSGNPKRRRSRSPSPRHERSPHRGKHSREKRPSSPQASSSRTHVRHREPKEDERRDTVRDERSDRDRERRNPVAERPDPPRSSRNDSRRIDDRRGDLPQSRWNDESGQARERNRPRSPRNPARRAEDVEMDYGRAERGSPQRKDKDAKVDQPNFGLSGKLLEDTNMVNGVVITYAQPPEARKPKSKWRLYPFKGDESLPIMHIHRQSAYLLGRDRRIVDIPIDHPSCSKQHAVIQYRMIPTEKSDGTVVRLVKPYILDLNSGNGTLVNDKKIEPQRFVELMQNDVIKFGFSSREYVMIKDEEKKSEPAADQSDGEKSD